MTEHIKPRILFILKDRSFGSGGGYSMGYSSESRSSGLWTSANLVHNMLCKNSIESKLVDVVDANSIDKEVTIYKPTVAIIEALFVTPEKLLELSILHPKIRWVVRLHSEIPFISSEGIFSQWIHQYVRIQNVSISANSKRMQADLQSLLKVEVGYMPNYYELDDTDGVALPETEQSLYSLNDATSLVDKSEGIVNVCCFGAIRPLKNQLQQAISAIHFAETIGKTMHFHINATRIENNSDTTIKNIRHLFLENGKHKLVEHLWAPHKNFLNTLKLMDIGMQVSMSETFCIVASDLVAMGIPVVTSPEVAFISKLFQADPTDSVDIKNALLLAWSLRKLNAHRLNYCKLSKNAKRAEKVWIELFSN